MLRLVVGLALVLAACGPKAEERAPEAPIIAKMPQSPNAATLKAFTVSAAETSNQAAESVAKVIMLDRGDAKLFSTVGGDPAINGEYVFLALVGDPAEGTKVFQIGDFNTWSLVSQTPDSAVLLVNRSAIDEVTGEIVTFEQKLTVAVPAFEATSVAVSPTE
jgi:hypothetical protein